MAMLLLLPSVSGLVEVTVSDGSIAQMTATPSSSDPGPITWSLTDGFTFTCGNTDEKGAMYLEVALATAPSGAETATIQGTAHTVADWWYAARTSSGDFLSINVTGVFDADAASYTVPAGYTDSQGTLSVVRYANADPGAGPTTLTRYWAYDATNNRYQVGTSKDLTATGDLVHPIAAAPAGAVASDMETAVSTGTYIVSSVGSSGAGYPPTIMQGTFMPPTGGCTVDTFMLIDLPEGAAMGNYPFTLRATATALGV